MNTQKVYTFPDRELFGEFDLIQLVELRIKIVKGEIGQQLCLIDSNDRAYLFDEFAHFGYNDEFIDCKLDKLILELIKAQGEKLRTDKQEIYNIESSDELLPFAIDVKSDEIIAEAHGITPEEVENIFTGFVQEQNNQIRLSEMEVGKKLTIAAIRRNYDTIMGPRDLIIFARLQNIGKPNGEKHNQIKSNLLKLEIVEVGEVTDNYFDFMNNLNKLNKN